MNVVQPRQARARIDRRPMPSYGRIDREYAMHLASRSPEEDGPILMVNFMKYRAVAQYEGSEGPAISGKEADDRYAPSEILADIGATVVFFGDVEPGGDWDRVGIVRYPTRRAFFEMQNRRDFQERHVHKLAGMAHTIVCGALAEGVRAPAGGTRPRVLFEMVTRGTSIASPAAGRLRVEGTILGDGRRFATLAVSWVTEDVHPPVAAVDRVVAMTRPSIDRLAGELSLTAPPTADTWR
jgi:hypothetical protein